MSDEFDPYIDEIDKLTEMLCRMLKVLDEVRMKFRFNIILPEDIQKWWDEYQDGNLDDNGLKLDGN